MSHAFTQWYKMIRIYFFLKMIQDNSLFSYLTAKSMRINNQNN